LALAGSTAGDVQQLVGNDHADLAQLDPRHVEHHYGDPTRCCFVLVGVEGEDAKRLKRIAEARGQKQTMSSPTASRSRARGFTRKRKRCSPAWE